MSIVREIITLSDSYNEPELNMENKKHIIWNLENGWDPIYDNNKLLRGKLPDFDNIYKFKGCGTHSATIHWSGAVKNLVFSLKYKNLFDNHFEFDFKIDKDEKISKLIRIYEIVDVFDRKELPIRVPEFKVKTIREAMIKCLLYFHYQNI